MVASMKSRLSHRRSSVTGLTLLLAASVAPGRLGAASAGHPPAADAAAYWSFDEIEGGDTVPDAAGNGHHGTIVRSKRIEGAFEPTLRPGIRGKALLCGGGKQYGYYVTVPDPPKLEGPFTLCMWVKPSGGQWLTRIIYHKQSWHTREGVELQMGGNRLSLVSRLPVGKQELRKLQARMPIQPKYWTFVTVLWDGKSWCVYMNGLLVAEDDGGQCPYSRPPDGVPLNLGGYTTHTNNTFTGLIDEVRVWRRALSAGDIEQVMLGDLRPYVP